ncbi:MAG: TrpB-like pyridoxal phosphate-dependent enzyme [Limnochordia bacterium]|jgi:tryptophan synthase beta chain
MSQKKIFLPETEIPRQWYNIQADMGTKPPPPLHPGTKKPVTPEDFGPLFPESLIEQEMTDQRWIDIPEPVLEAYRIWRPSPLVRAVSLERALKTPARIYFKNEGVSPAGSHKVNTSVPQAYYNKEAGVRRLSTETGAGQWGSALSFATGLFGLACTVYMVRVSYEQKPYRRSLMEVWGGEVIPSPSPKTQAGREILLKNPDSPGSLGIAISEAVEDAVGHDDTRYALGSVLNHVLLHQTIIGLEAKKQLALVDDYPDIVIASCGGGSNFAGLAFPFLADKFAGKEVRAIAVEPAACPTLTKGKYAYDYGDTAGLTPILSMYTLGHSFMPPGIHAGGLRYHGQAPLVSQLYRDGLIEARAYGQQEIFASALLFSRTEGILPAPESAHAIHGAIEEARECARTGQAKTILFNLSGHGHFDLAAYDTYLAGRLENVQYSEAQLEAAMEDLPQI